MKRMVSAVLAAAMVFSLAACGGSGTAAGGAAASAAAQSAAADTAADETAAEDEAAPEAVSDGGPVYGATLEEQVVLDDAEYGIKMTATGMRMGTQKERTTLYYRTEGSIGQSSTAARDDVEYLYLDFTVENTSDKDYMVEPAYLTVDGCVVGSPLLQHEETEGYGPYDFPAGESVEAYALISTSTLALYDIETISDISFIVWVSPQGDARDDTYASERCTLTTSAYGEYTHTFTPEGDILYDEGGITVALGQPAFNGQAFLRSVAGGGWDGFYYAPLFLSNQTEETLWFIIQDTNGTGGAYTRNNYFDVMPGTCELVDLPLSCNATDGTVTDCEVAFDILISDNDSGDDPIATLDSVTLSFDDSEAEAYYASMPTSEEEAEALLAESDG